jgi:hypothetical protein
VCQSTVAKYMARHRQPPSQTSRTILKNHTKDLVSLDFSVVPIVTFELLFTVVILSHDRRRLVTANLTAAWTARQLLGAFPWDHAPRYLMRDRGSAYGLEFGEMAKSMGTSRSAACAPESLAERLSRSTDRIGFDECLDHVIVLNETGLRRVVKSYFAYCEQSYCATTISWNGTSGSQ